MMDRRPISDTEASRRKGLVLGYLGDRVFETLPRTIAAVLEWPAWPGGWTNFWNEFGVEFERWLAQYQRLTTVSEDIRALAEMGDNPPPTTGEPIDLECPWGRPWE